MTCKSPQLSPAGLASLAMIFCASFWEASGIELFLHPTGPNARVHVFADSGQLTRSLNSPDGGFVSSFESQLTFDPQRRLVGISGTEIWRYDFQDRRFTTVANFSSVSGASPAGFTVAPDGKFYVQATRPVSTISYFDGETGQLRGNIGSPTAGFAGSSSSHLTFGPDGNLFGIAGQQIWKYDFTTASYSFVVDFSAVSPPSPGGFTLGPDGTFYLLAVGPGGTISTFDGETGELTGNLGTFDGGRIGSFEGQLTFGPRGALYGIDGARFWKYNFESASFSVIGDFSQVSSPNPGGFAVSPGPQRPEDLSISRTSALPEGREIDMTIERDSDVGDLTVHFAINADVTTAAPSDYSFTTPDGLVDGPSFSVTVPDGETEVVVKVRAIPDILAEPRELVRLNIVDSPDYHVSSNSFRDFDIFANGLTVTNTNGSGEGSLRQAIANASDFGTADDEITFSDELGVPFSTEPQTITLDSFVMQLREPVAVKGPELPGHVTIDANYTSTALWLSGSDGAVIENLTIMRGMNTSSTSIAAGIHISSTGATLRNVTVRDCRNQGAVEASSDDVFMYGCSIINNESNFAAALEISGIGNCELYNCTISGNRSGGFEGVGINLNRGNRLSLTNVTITDNAYTFSGVADPPLIGAGIGGDPSDFSRMTLEITNSIVAGNRFRDNQAVDIVGSWHSGGHNLIGIGDGAGGFTGSDLVGTTAAPVDARLLPLADNGGTTLSHLPRADSPAIEGGDSSANENEFEQRGRGFPRIVGDTIDIGAVEVQRVVSLATDELTVVETDDQTAALVLRLERTGPLGDSLGLNWEAIGTGENPAGVEDFSSSIPDGRGSFLPGSAILELRLPLEGDNLAEPTETFVLAISPQEGSGEVGLAPSLRHAVFSIIDDDAAPVARDDPQFSVIEDSLLTITDPTNGVLDNDRDADDSNLQAVLITPPPNAETFSLNPDGTFSYQPVKDFLGTDQFTYAASDGSNQSADTTATITVVPQADLGISISASRDPVLAGVGLPRNLTHTITTTNRGPSDISNLTIGINLNGEVRALLLGALAEGETTSRDFYYDVEADTPMRSITTAITSAAADQPVVNPEDDSPTETTTIISARDIGTTKIAPLPSLELQSGLFVQELRITNNNQASVPAIRLHISGLPDDVVAYNASGGLETGSPYVDLVGPFAVGKSITAGLQFFSEARNPAIDPTYQIELIEMPDSNATPDGERFAIDRLLGLPDGRILVEWPSRAGVRYSIQYSHDGQNWMTVVPAIRSTANRLQWIDRGLPGTSSPPSEVLQRQYRVVDGGS